MRVVLITALFAGFAAAQNPIAPLAQNAFGTIATIPNSSTGTTINKLASLTGGKAIITTAGATSGVIGIVIGGAGTSGNATIQTEASSVSCVFDGATTAGDYVQISASVNGDCTDAGSTLPSSGQVLGVVLGTNAGGGTFKMFLSGGSGGSGGGGGVASVTVYHTFTSASPFTVTHNLNGYPVGNFVNDAGGVTSGNSAQTFAITYPTVNTAVVTPSGTTPTSDYVAMTFVLGTSVSTPVGYTYSYLRPISQNTLASAPFSISSTNYNISNSVQGSNSGLITQTASAWTYGTTPLVKNSTQAKAVVMDFEIPLNSSWISTMGLTFQAIWTLPTGSSAAGNLLLQVRGQAVCSGGSLGSYSANLPFTASTAGVAGVQNYTAVLTGTTSNILSGASAPCIFYGQLFRDGTQAGDTLNDPADTPTSDAQLIMLVVGNPGGVGGAQGGPGPAGAAGSQTRGLVFSFAGTSLVNGAISPSVALPSATCSIAAWDIVNQSTTGASATDTNTIKILRAATGTNLAIGNSINTSGVSVSATGSAHSTTLSDFTNTGPFNLYDRFAAYLSSYGGVAGQITVTLSLTGCN